MDSKQKEEGEIASVAMINDDEDTSCKVEEDVAVGVPVQGTTGTGSDGDGDCDGDDNNKNSNSNSNSKSKSMTPKEGEDGNAAAPVTLSVSSLIPLTSLTRNGAGAYAITPVVRGNGTWSRSTTTSRRSSGQQVQAQVQVQATQDEDEDKDEDEQGGGGGGSARIVEVVEAVCVEEQQQAERAQMEAEIRDQLQREAVQASVVSVSVSVADPDPDPVTATATDSVDVENQHHHQQLQSQRGKDQPQSESKNSTRETASGHRCKSVRLGILLVIIAVALVVGVTLGLQNKNKHHNSDPNASNSSNATESTDASEQNGQQGLTTDTDTDANTPMIAKESTLETVKDRGFLNCGIYDAAMGFSYPDSQGHLQGINVDQCRAMSIAIFGNPNQYQPVIVNSKIRFPMLANHSADLLANTVTHTMGRDVFEPNTMSGFAFSQPYFYSGLAFAGVPSFVECADKLDTFNGDCRLLKVCVGAGTTHEQIVKDMLEGTYIVVTETREEAVQRLNDTSCNVIASEPVTTPPQRFIEMGYYGPFQVGQKVFSKEPLALVTRQDDVQWTNLVNAVVNTFFLAEAYNITRATAQDFKLLYNNNNNNSNINNDADDNMGPLTLSTMIAIIAELGNYGELYDKHLEAILSRQNINRPNKGDSDTGLLYSIPFGDVETQGPDPIPGSPLETIVTRGYLRCGILETKPGFAQWDDREQSWSGLNVEFCRLIASALFLGEASKTMQIIDLSSPSSSLTMSPKLGNLSSVAANALRNDEVDVVAGVRITLQAMYERDQQWYAFSPSYYYNNEDGNAFALMTLAQSSQWTDFVYWTVMAIIYAEEEGILQSSFLQMPVVSLFGERFKQMFRDAVSSVGSYGEIYNRTLENVIHRSGANKLNDGLSGPQQYPVAFQ